MQRGDFRAHLDAQLRIEIRQRLVEQEDRRIANNRASDRDALPLATRKLRRPSLEQGFQLQHFCRRLNLGIDLCSRCAEVLETEGQILIHGHVRIERVGLEHHREPAL